MGIIHIPGGLGGKEQRSVGPDSYRVWGRQDPRTKLSPREACPGLDETEPGSQAVTAESTVRAVRKMATAFVPPVCRG